MQGPVSEGLKTWFYNMHTKESKLWYHDDYSLRLMFRRSLYASVSNEAGRKACQNFAIYDHEEVPVAEGIASTP